MIPALRTLTTTYIRVPGIKLKLPCNGGYNPGIFFNTKLFLLKILTHWPPLQAVQYRGVETLLENAFLQKDMALLISNRDSCFGLPLINFHLLLKWISC